MKLTLGLSLNFAQTYIKSQKFVKLVLIFDTHNSLTFACGDYVCIIFLFFSTKLVHFIVNAFVFLHYNYSRLTVKKKKTKFSKIDLYNLQSLNLFQTDLVFPWKRKHSISLRTIYGHLIKISPPIIRQRKRRKEELLEEYLLEICFTTF
jgi:hypothetical protein